MYSVSTAVTAVPPNSHISVSTAVITVTAVTAVTAVPPNSHISALTHKHTCT